jgi:hypothetical protein
VLYLLLGGEFVAAGQVLVYGRRRDGDVPVRDRLPRRPHDRGAVGRRAVVAGVGAVLAAGAILVEVIVAIGSTAATLSHEAHIARSFGSPASIGRSSSPTTCSRSRSPRSCCSSPPSAASCSARTRARALEETMHGPDVAWYLVLAACSSSRARSACSSAAAR